MNLEELNYSDVKVIKLITGQVLLGAPVFIGKNITIKYPVEHRAEVFPTGDIFHQFMAFPSMLVKIMPKEVSFDVQHILWIGDEVSDFAFEGYKKFVKKIFFEKNDNDYSDLINNFSGKVQ